MHADILNEIADHFAHIAYHPLSYLPAPIPGRGNLLRLLELHKHLTPSGDELEPLPDSCALRSECLRR